MANNGTIRLLLNTDPGVNPPPGRVYVWVENVAGDKVYKYRDENGVVGNIGTAGAVPNFTSLPDTPGTYTGQADKHLKVKNDETGVEFVADPYEHWELNSLHNEGISPVNNGEISIGLPEAGRESVFGCGDSYTGVGNVYAYTYNGVTYVDETTKITTEDSDKLTFPGLTDGNMIYVASRRNNGVNNIKHSGIKIVLDIATVLGAGDIVFEFWNGASWEEFNHQSTDSDVPYYGHANEKFEQTGTFHYLFNNTISSTWIANDPMSLGTNHFWIRLRISGTITASPSFDRIKLHPPGRTEINEDGFLTFSGLAQPSRILPVYYGLFNAAGNSPLNKDIYLSDKLDVGMVENEFQTGTTDRTGFKIAVPPDLCTANSVKLNIAFFTDSNTGSGDIDFTIRWALFRKGSLIYHNTSGAPSTAIGERSIASSYTMPANVRWELQEATLNLEIPEAIAEKVDGLGDYFILTFERLGASDSFGGDITMVDVRATYTAWKLGGHI